jgi:hypothetical protein
MGVWVLRTETKGTGATMVPLESVTTRPPVVEPVTVPRKPRPRAKEVPQPKPPLKFRVVDVISRQPLVDGAGARETVDALKGVRSIVDVSVYVWQEERARWRMLSFPERRALWELAAR